MSRLPSPAVLQWGTERPLAQVMTLRAGPLSMTFEPQSAFLRYVRLGEREIVRGIYAAVRNHNWDTIAPRVFNLQSQVNERSFHLRFDVECCQDDVDFLWHGEISGDERGTVVYSMRGQARRAFRRNRIGFCVLHPMNECAGQRCTVEHTDGLIEQGRFPDAIAPHQPFFDIRAITHSVTPGVRAEVRCKGDTFEMEDQRNWTDASFKTYCTPLGLPFPVEVLAGTTIEQSVTIRLHGAANATQGTTSSAEIVVSVDEAASQPLPALGLGMASHNEALSDNEIARLKALAAAHLRVDIHLARDYAALWQRACTEARHLETALEVALFVTDAAKSELHRFVEKLQAAPAIARWIIFHENEKSTARHWVEMARQSLSHVSAAPIGAGSNAYFTEVNRERPPVEALDFVSFSLNPQVHAFDNASLVESLQTQATVVNSARQLAGELPIVISPVTLRPRFNAAATGPQPGPAPGELPSQVDVRQMSLFGAAWTLGSIKYLALSGAASVTYYETTGWRGVMEKQSGSPLASRFPSVAGAVFPLYHVLAEVAEFAGGSVLLSQSSAPLKIECLALRKAKLRCVLLANFSAQTQRVRLTGMRGTARVKVLDASSVMEAMTAPETFRGQPGVLAREVIELPPSAVARVDFAEDNIS